LNHLVRIALCLSLLSAAACAKKEPKPLRTEPWLAHPPPGSEAKGDAGTKAIHYAITAQSLVRFELPSRRGVVRGTVRRVSGEFDLDPGDLSRSRGQVRADLTSLSLQSTAESDGAALLARALSALELSDAGPSSESASFELTALEDLSAPGLEPAPETDAATPFTRRLRATAVGNFLLHGFRVVRRAPLEAEFGFAGDRQLPDTVMIRSRAPFVVSLEMHALRVLDHEGRVKAGSGPASQAREVRVSVELCGKKLN
jgi:hypothetical protein